MATPKITRIVYREYDDDLFNGQDAAGIEIGASGWRFLELLGEALGKAYPSAMIDCRKTAQPIQHDRRIIVETSPINDETGDVLRFAEETAVDVADIATEVYERGEWYVDTGVSHA